MGEFITYHTLLYIARNFNFNVSLRTNSDNIIPSDTIHKNKVNGPSLSQFAFISGVCLAAISLYSIFFNLGRWLAASTK
jgi:hypothetical protein